LPSAAESAAAIAKARKKLLKIQGIASQADKAHSSVIVDVGVLTSEAAAAEEEQAAAEGRAQASNSSTAAGRGSEASGAQERRSSKQGEAGSSPSAGKLSMYVKHNCACYASKQQRALPCTGMMTELILRDKHLARVQQPMDACCLNMWTCFLYRFRLK
jgi:hypothetical protein